MRFSIPILIATILVCGRAVAHEDGDLDSNPGTGSPTTTVPAVKVDERCLRPEGFNLSDTKAVQEFNKLCAIEQEVVRRTNEYRAKYNLPALRYNPQLGFVMRYQATLQYNTRNPHQHFHNNIPSYYYQKWFADGRKLFMARENAFWASGHNAKSAADIAFLLADDATNGWNNHPGHHENVLANNTTDIGVGVSLRPDGQLVAFTVFGIEQQ